MRSSAIRMILGSTLMAAALALTGAANAKQEKRSHAKPYQAHARVMTREGLPERGTKERSFLDPGPVSSSSYGNEQAYMTANTYFNRTSDQDFARSKFGNEALPRPLEVPGNDRPIFQFETPSYPY